MFKRIYRVVKDGHNFHIQTTMFGVFWNYLIEPGYTTHKMRFSSEKQAEEWIKDTIQRRQRRDENKKVFRG